MKKIHKIIKTKDDFDKMLIILSDRVKENKPISENGMLDGFVIGLIVSSGKFSRDLFLNRDMGWTLDGTIQKLEHIYVWVCNNENELYKILKKK